MENLTCKKTLKVVFFMMAMLLFQSCSSMGPKKKISQVKKKKWSSRFANFDRKKFPNDALVISNMISIVQPELEIKERDTIATCMSKALEKNKIEPQIMVAIIDTESNFKQEMVSSTGDLSLAQINVDVWNKEFIRLKKQPIDREKLKKDLEYAMIKMAQILSILKKRFEFKDRKWYARYHSGTRQYKTDYLQKLDIRLRMLAMSPVLNRSKTDNRLAQSN